MKKIYSLIFLLFTVISFSQNFGSFASGIKINNTIYNTTASAPIQQINPDASAQNFNGLNLGTFGQNSTCAKITGGEIKTFKNTLGNVCSGTLLWRVYPQASSPSGVFNTISLSEISDCNLVTSTFNDGFGPCGTGDQKWKNYSISQSFISSLVPGNYVLEIFFNYTGSNSNPATCETTNAINNSGANFKANFAIVNPTCNPVASPSTLCQGDTLTLTANPANGIAPYSYSWSGPNGYTSALENPTITNVSASNNGTYSLIVTDSCGAVSSLQTTSNVTIIEKTDPFFEGLNPGLCRFGTPPFLPNQSTNGILGTWNPQTVNNANVGTFFYTFTPDAGQCANTFVQTIFVVNNVNPSFTLPTAICMNSNPPVLNTTSNNGIVGVWNPTTVSNTSSGSYVFTPNAGQCANTRTVTINVTPNVIPNFTLPSSVCQNGPIPALPTTSINGITGTWNPSIVNNTIATTYQFIPNNPSQCGMQISFTIFVNPNVTPTFNAVAPICENATAPVLPLTSTNGITGTWNPSTVNNTTSGTYTFTPNSNQCAVTTTLNVTVNPNITPTFEPIPNVCYLTTPPSLPSISLEGITGTWNPSVISNTASGTYTFTPSSGLCALPATLNVTVDIITPEFNVINPICSGTTAPTLATTSNNGITGNWNPSVVSNTNSASYTFTPNANQCATTLTINVIVNPIITPIFTAISPLCENEIPPSLPTTSNNGISGSWNPVTINNSVTGTYTFTPDSGFCANSLSITVVVNPKITPTFNSIDPICENATAPTLQSISNDGISGTWNPSIVSNTASGTYTFTPNSGECATITTLDIDVFTNETPLFNSIAPICFGSTAPTLPLNSTNEIFGTWNPSVVSNTNSGTYTFTPNAGICATTATLNITVSPNVVPTFNSVPDLCYQTTAPVLPTTSTNGVTGTWNPAFVSNTASGTYTFTPNSNQCATTTSLTVTVQTITPTFTEIPPVCNGSTVPNLPTTSNNSITGIWNPATISNTTSGTYTFTPDENQCAITTTISVTVETIVPLFNPIPDVCYGTTSPVLQSVSNNGITGNWNPSIISNTVSGTYVFTPNENQCASTQSLQVNVTTINPTFSIVSSICENANAPLLPSTSTNGITGSWNPVTISNTNSGTYTFTPDPNQCATVASLDVLVNANVTPTFNEIPPVCYQSDVPVLQLTSTNGIEGTWNPATVSNTESGTYTFTPNNGICALPISIVITVTTTIPTFVQIEPVCFGSTPPTLPSFSTNEIAGTWNPSIISNTTAGTYIFTPNANQCATIYTMNIAINSITPTFNTIAPICENATAPILQTRSNNGITGIWNPNTINNTTTGTYTFTPDENQCATVNSITVTVSPIVTPTFTAIADVCYGTESPILPLVSNNGINGTWNPENISNTISNNYTFTPNAGECAVATIITVNVTTIAPTFDSISPICENSTAPILPTISLNGISGTWNPSTVSTTLSGTYEFTPNVNQCATTTSLTVTVNPNVTPVFDEIAPICYNSTAPILPLTSTNGISGTWNPDVVSSTTSLTYTFTPNAGICATTASITTTINTIIPNFNAIADVCFQSTPPTLPSISTNGITGTWNPATVSNTQPGTYEFTPDANQCAVTTSLQININVINPTFNAIPDICFGSVAPTLPTTSNNGIVGTWNPDIVSNTTPTLYTFTPNAGQCATTATLQININSITPTFASINAICEGSTAPILPTTSQNNITGTWNSLVDNTVTGTYTFTPDANQCATTVSVTIVVNIKTIPVFPFGTSGSGCQGASLQVLIPQTSSNGINGTWNPNTLDFSILGTTIYTFTPNVGECAVNTTYSLAINVNITPTFNSIAPICSGSPSPVLPLTSLNGFSGTWNPSIVNTTTSGTYTFIPTVGQCATTATLQITVNPSPTDISLIVSSVLNQTAQGVIEITGVTSGVAPFQYSINNGSFSNSTSFTNLLPGDYVITVLDANGCVFNKTITVETSCIFPNGISPNGDGKNDTFNLNGCNVTFISFFNRYGVKINSFSNYTSQWDGTTFDSKNLPDGTYFYTAELLDGNVKTGWVYVAR